MAPDGRETLTAIVQSLRQDSDVADALYWDTTVPTEPAARDRVYPGDPAAVNDSPVEVAVRLSAGAASATSKSVQTRAYIAECTVVALEGWYERYQSLRMWDIFDAVQEVNVLPPAANLLAEGMTTGSAGIEVDDETGRRVLGGRWRFQTSDARY